MTSDAAAAGTPRETLSMPPLPLPPPLFRIVTSTSGTSVCEAAAIGAASAAELSGRSEVSDEASGARLGMLQLPGRAAVSTPNFFAVTSRGALPHVTPGHVAGGRDFDGAYLALEDFIEAVPQRKQHTPAIYSAPSASSLGSTSTSSTSLTSFAASPSRIHSFAALSPSTVTVLAPRRHPAAVSHLGNGAGHISIVTSTGFQKLTVDAYRAAVAALEPDIAVGLADLTYGIDADADVDGVLHPATKRAVRMAERTEDWVDLLVADVNEDDTVCDKDAPRRTHVFAPTLPTSYAVQWSYLNRLAELATQESVTRPRIAGLAVYDVDLLPDITADYPDSLASLPRLSLHPASTPQQMLRQIALGVDVLLLPGITAASEQGLAYVFAWDDDSPDDKSKQPLPLALDLSDPWHKTSLAPLAVGCTCTVCTHHHRAYVHHLLNTREMLAWTLLQLHNHTVVATFLAGARARLARGGPSLLAADARRFTTRYTATLPVGRAERPRVRGYQGHSTASAAPLNAPAWGRLDRAAAAVVR